MVYHHPSEQPMGNTIPVLRLLLSDSASAKFFRYVPGTALAAAASLTGTAVLARSLAPGGAGAALWAPAESAESPKQRSKLLWLVGAAVCAAGVRNAVLFTVRKWEDHVCPPPAGIDSEYTFFRVVEEVPEDAEGARAVQQQFGKTPGIAFVKSVKKFMAHPPLSVDAALERSFNTVGMSLKDFVTMDFTVGLEYALTAWTRILRHSFGGALGWHEPVSATSRYRLYQAVLNTSLVCFTRTHHGDMDADLDVDVGGHVVLGNVRLPFADVAHRTFRKVVLFVDHEAMELEKVVLVRDRDTGGVEVTTWGARDHALNTEGRRITAEESLHQAGLIMAAVVAFFTHGIVHWWATAVASMPKAVWPAGAAESTVLTQWTNTQAVLSAGFFIGNSAIAMADVVSHNALNGLPAHGVAPASRGEEQQEGVPPQRPITMRRPDAKGQLAEVPLFAALGERSTFHQMSAAAGAALKRHFEGREVTEMEIRGIVVACVQHGLEHYMLGELTPIFSQHSQCIALKTDLSGLLHCLVYPVSYVSRPFVHCRLRYWDDVALTIHRACVEREKSMVATNSAAAAKGEPVPFTPLKGFCDWYLHVGCSV